MPEVRFRVRLTPRAGGDRVGGVGEDGSLLARVAGAPADGAANAALLGLLARELRLPRAAVRLVRGATSRSKWIAVDGPGPAELAARWPGLLVGSDRAPRRPSVPRA